MTEILIYNHFSEIAAKLTPALGKIVSKTATSIATNYRGTAPRRTGFMANSVYVVTAQGSTYGQGGGSPPGDSYLLPQVEAPDDETTAYTAVAANYAVYPELGTRFQSAQPAFYPAVDAARTEFEGDLGQLEDLLR